VRFALTQGHPEALAAFGAPRDVTHAELWGLARAIGDALSHVGAEGAPVLLLCEDRYYFAAALLGAWQAGLTVTLPPSRGSAAVGELGAKSLVVHDGAPAQGARASIDVRELEAQLPSLRTDARPPADVDGERVLVTLYTSGSQGEPVAWQKRAHQLLGEARVQVQELGLSARDRVLPTVPAQHIYGLLFGVLAPLLAGASFARQTPLHGPAILGLARASNATWLVSVPAHLEVLATGLEQSVAASLPPSLRQGVSSGAVLLPSLAKRLARGGLTVTDVLGSTETGGIARRRPAECERYAPFSGVSLSLDGDDRLVIRSPFLAEPERAYVTGDRARFADDGTFEHLGRGDDVVKVGGKRIALVEVEATARALPGVFAVAALKQDVGGLRGQEIWLAAVAPGYSPELLRQALRQKLDPVLVPRRVRIVEALPADERGKSSRARLRELFEGAASREVVRRESLTSAESEARACYHVPANSARYEGHFVGDPLLPALAQLHDLVLPTVRASWPELGALTRMSRVKFTSPIRPGARVAVVLSRRGERVDFALELADAPSAAPADSGAAEGCARGILHFAARSEPAREERS
jgi:acyl-coenzyme A synthetase/AMP-(fatty) acid ligase